jgi:hypothetical protein
VHLLDAEGVVRLVLDVRGWRDDSGSTARLEQVLDGHGIAVESTPVPLDASLASDDPLNASAGTTPPWDVGTPFACFGLILFVPSLIGILALLYWIDDVSPVAGQIAVVTAVVLILGPAIGGLVVFARQLLQYRGLEV